MASSGSGIEPIVKEEPLARRPQLPIAQGYGQSKYICEHLCAAAKHLWGKYYQIINILFCNFNYFKLKIHQLIFIVLVKYQVIVNMVLGIHLK